MAAEKGNRHGEKWDKEKTEYLFNEIKTLIELREIQYVMEIGIVSNYSTRVVQRTLNKFDLYDSLLNLIREKKPTRESLYKLTKEQKKKRVEWLKKRYHKKYKHDPNFRIRASISSSLNYHIKNRGAKRSSSKSKLDMLDFKMQELRDHLKNQFTKGMSFDNYGKWHIDHIIPCSWFNLSDETQFKQCWDLRNLKPMWGNENTSKCNRYSENTQLNLKYVSYE